MRKFVKKGNEIITDRQHHTELGHSLLLLGAIWSTITILLAKMWRTINILLAMMWKTITILLAKMWSTITILLSIQSVHIFISPPSNVSSHTKIRYLKCGRFQFSNYKLQVKPTKIEVLFTMMGLSLITNCHSSNGNVTTQR